MARAVAGMISNVGLLESSDEELIRNVYEQYVKPRDAPVDIFVCFCSVFPVMCQLQDMHC